MKSQAKHSILVAGLLATFLGAVPARVTAQIAQAPAAAPVFLAMPDRFPDLDARAVLMLEPGRDIVVLNRDDADAETLDVALGVLERMYRDHPRPADRGQLVPITGFVYRGTLEPAEREALEEALASLRERPLANVGNLGPGRWLRLR